MDAIWSGILGLADIISTVFFWCLGKLWDLWYGTYLWLIPSVGAAGAFLMVTIVPLVIVLVLLYMGIAKTQIGIETFGHSSFQVGLFVVGVILVIVILGFILPSLE